MIDPLLSPFTAEPAGRQLLGWGIGQFVVFSLVLLRVAGLMTIGPLYGNRTIPMRSKALLSVAIAALLTPVLSAASAGGFARLDEDGSGRVERSEVPEPLADRFERRLRDLSREEEGWLKPEEWPSAAPLPTNVADV